MLICLLALAATPVLAQTSDVPVSRSARLTGNLNFVTTGGSLRSQPNTGNACAVSGTSTAALSGVPAAPG